MIKNRKIKERVIEIYQSEEGRDLTKTKIGQLITEEFNLDWDSEKARKFSSNTIRDFEQFKDSKIETDKKTGVFNWRDVLPNLQSMQKIFDNASFSQDRAKVKIDTKEPIAIVVLGDLHMASWGTDYELLRQVTDELVNTPNLYAILVGDLLQMSINLRGVLEVSDNALPPKFQMEFLASWLEEVKHKILWATWDNHSVMREEKNVGFSKYSEIFNRHVIYHNHIGHVDLTVGNQVYKIASAHFFRGRSIENPCHGQMRYMRREGIDREICVAGDSHVPGIVKYTDGGVPRLAMNSGTLQTNSGYGKRFFSLITAPNMPCMILDPEEHIFTPYWSVREWLKAKQ